MTKLRTRDPDLGKFQKTNLFFEDDDYLSVQDPTVTSFKLSFDFYSSPLLSPPPKNAPDKETSEEISDDMNTAEGYLRSIGENSRAKYLKAFKSHLSALNQKLPWYFQSVSGVDEAWGRNFREGPLLTDRSLQIQCLEDVQFKMSALMDLYRKACFDWRFRREIVPKNLREFGMSLYVIEARRFHFDFLKQSEEENGRPSELIKKHKEMNKKSFGYTDENSEPMSELDLDSINRFLFHFYFCEFNIEESGTEFFSELDNSSSEVASQNLTINYQDVEEDNLYNFIGGSKISDDIVGTLDIEAMDVIKEAREGFNVGDPIKGRGHASGYDEVTNSGELQEQPTSAQDVADFFGINLQPAQTPSGEEFLDNTIDAASRQAAGAVEGVLGRANRLFLGNVYGFSPSQSGQLAQEGAVGSLVQDAGTSLSNRNTTVKGDDNVFDQSSPSLVKRGG